MGSIQSYNKIKSHYIYRDETELIRMEQLALSYTKMVNGNPNMTYAIELLSDDDIITILNAAPVNQIDVLLLYGVTSERIMEEERLTKEGILNLSFIVEHNKTLKAFGFLRNHLSKENAKILCDAIVSLPFIQYISFLGTNMNSELADSIIDQLKMIPTLQELHLGGNPFKDGYEKKNRLRKEGFSLHLRYDY